jgi:flagellar basal-body rod modification protein FlgD
MTTTPPVGTNTTNNPNTSNSNSAANKASVDYNSFLKLLVTQMQNQDPTQPMDATQYVSQPCYLLQCRTGRADEQQT